MYQSLKKRTTTYLLCLAGLSACSGEADPAAELAANLATAEGMIDAFYSFDASILQPYLSEAGEAGTAILGYQAWAEGGNYIVMERVPCVRESEDTIACAITVQDDPVVALETGFNVTDTFHITFTDAVITGVETSSNDQPIYYEARKWVEANLPEVMEGPCKRVDGVRETPGDCARAMTDGYRQFMVAKKAEAEADSAFIPDDFEPPVLVETDDFTVVPLGPELVDLDFAAYMSSIEHLQQTFTRSEGWPHENITDADAMQDMLNEQERFKQRESFAYAVLTPGGEREMGCVYVRPSSKPGYDAEVSLWVTKADFDAGFDETLYEWTQLWVEENWSFAEVAYPGRAIEWTAWDQL
ncbi:MAG: hypothetical protein HQ498_10765 [Pseudohongiella sp.]|nr:hypothetical protein [Pseudohongiella sp.]